MTRSSGSGPGWNGYVEKTVTYALRDRLGSTVGLADGNRVITQRLNFDAFGKTRNGDFTDRSASPPGSLGLPVLPGALLLQPNPTIRGFTGHEHLDNAELIHMNGRAYDYNLGRFLGVDPVIQFPTNSQSLNPYSYIMNNPMAGRDPSGYRIRMPPGSVGCSGAPIARAVCQAESDRKFLGGAAGALRDSLRSGGAPAGTWNGWEDKQRARVKNSKPSVEVGAVLDISDGVMVAQSHVLTDEEYREIMGEDNPRDRMKKGNKTAGKIMGTLGEILEPGPEDAIGFIGKVKDIKKVGNAIVEVSDELNSIRKASNAGVDDLLAAANKPINDTGLTEAARAWDKHSKNKRAGGTFAPLTGNVSQKNAKANNYLQDLLTNPSTVRKDLSKGGVEFRSPDGQGIRFDADGSLSTFLDPRI